MNRIKYIFTFIGILLGSVVYSQTLVSGSINSNTTWSDPSYELTGNITVSADVTLTISSGVIVDLASSGYDLTVNGTLVIASGSTMEFPSVLNDLLVNDTLTAIGNSTDTIRFIGTNASTSVHGGNVHISSSSSGSALDYVKFVKMGDGSSPLDGSLVISTNDVSIDNIRIDDSEISGLKLTNNATPTIGALEVTNSQYGIEIVSGSPVFTGSILTNNTNGALITTGSAQFNTCTIDNSSNYGVWINGAATPTLSNSQITNNGQIGIFIDERTVPILTNNTITGTKQVVVPTDQVDKITWTGNGITTLNLAQGYNVMVNTTLANEVWDYIVDLDVIVDAGITLTIDPGVTLGFPSVSNDLIVNGTLSAVGNAVDSIFFVGTNASSSVHGGNVHISSSSTLSNLDYVKFRHMADGSSPLDGSLVISTNDVSIDNIRIDDSEISGLKLTNNATPTIGALEVTNSQYGIEIVSGSPVFTGSILTNNTNGALITTGSAQFNTCTIDNSSNYGVWINGAATPTLSNNQITNNGQIGIFIDERTVPILTNNTITGTKQVVVPTDQVDKITWTGNGITTLNLAQGYNVTVNTTLANEVWDYIVDLDVIVDAGITLTIDPGVTLGFPSVSNDLIVNGTLSAVGNAVDSIFFVGTNASSSVHGGNVHISSSSTLSNLDYVKFRHMADGSSPLDGSLVISTNDVSIDNIRIDDSEISGLKLTNNATPTIGALEVTNSQYGIEIVSGSPVFTGSILTNNTNGALITTGSAQFNTCTIDNSSNYGVWINGAATPTLSNSQITNNGQIGIFIDERTVPILTNNTITGTKQVVVPTDQVDKITWTGNGITTLNLAQGYNVMVNTTLANEVWDYIVDLDVIVDAGITLTIDPGVTLGFPSVSNDLIVNGTLSAVGNAVDSIFFVGTNASSSVHGGNVHISSSSTLSNLDYVKFRHMADGSSPLDGSLVISTNDVSIDNIRIDDSEISGLKLTNNATPTIGALEVTNSQYGIEIVSGSPVFTGSILTNNTNGALITTGSAQFNTCTIDGSANYGVWINGAATPTLSNSQITNNGQIGIFIDERTVPILTNNTITGTKQVVVPTDQVDKITWTGNGITTLNLAQGYNVMVNTTLANEVWDYIVDLDVIVDAGITLTIDPGVTLGFPSVSNDLIVNGTLSAVGNAVDSIFFVGTNASSSVHGGNVHISSSSTLSNLDYVKFRHMADGSSPLDGSLVISTNDVSIDNIRIDDSEISGLKLTNNATPTIGALEVTNSQYGIEIVSGSPVFTGSILTNNTNGALITTGSAQFNTCTIDNSSNYGVWINGAATPTLSNNQITNNGQIGIFIDERTVPILTNNTITGTKQVVVPTDQVDKITWTGNGITALNLAQGYNVTVNTTLALEPWRFISDLDVVVDNGITLTIEPGVTLEFPSVSNDLIVNGTLSALGTETDSIFFIGTGGASVHGGNVFLSSTSTGSVLQYVRFDHMSDGSSVYDASIEFATSDVSANHIKITDSEVAGMVFSNGATFTLDNLFISGSNQGIQTEAGASPTILQSSIINNTTGLYVLGGTPTINYSNIEGNSFMGVDNDAGGTVQATSNWWGDPTGPNPPGNGDGIEGAVNVTPFLITPDQFGLSFDGTDNVNVGDVTITDGLTQLTVEAWIKPSSYEAGVTANDGYSIVTKGTLSGISSNSFYSAITGNGTVQTFEVGVDDGSNISQAEVVAADFFPIGEWTHFAMTWQQGGGAELYVNGILVDTASTILSGTIFDTPSTLRLGASDWPEEDYYNGSMDEVRIWSTYKTESEIRQTMFGELTGAEPGLIAYYNFNIVTGDVLDQTVNGNDGTVIGVPVFEGSGAFQPELLQVTNASQNGFTANWIPVSNATNTLLEVATDAGFISQIGGSPFSVANTNGGIESIISTLTPATRYFARLRFQDLEFLSDYSEVVDFMVQPGNALDFDGTDDYVQSDNVVIPSTGDFTVELWAKKESSATGNRQIISQPRTASNHFYIGVNTGGNIRAGDNWIDIGVAYPDDDNWHHFALVKTDIDTKFFLDGVEVASLGSSINNPTIDQFRIGCTWNGVQEFWDGQIDEVRIWNIARSEAEIQSTQFEVLVGTEPGLKAYYRFDQGDAGNANGGVNSLQDLGINHFDGTLTGFTLSGAASNWVTSGAQQSSTPPAAPSGVVAYRTSSTEITLEWDDNSNDETGFRIERADDYNFTTPVKIDSIPANTTSYTFNAGTDQPYFYRVESFNGADSTASPVEYATTVGHPGSAILFDGASHRIEAGNDPILYNHQEFTLEAWIKPDYTNISDQGVILSTLAPASNGGGYQLHLESNGQVKVVYREAPFADRVVTSVQSLTAGQWYHVAGVVENAGANSNLYLYINGELDATSNPTGTPIYSNVAILRIGDNSDGGLDREFGGELDEVRIWSYARSQTEIQNQIDFPLNGNEPNLVAYFPFDENAGSITVDRSKNNNDGTLINGPAWTTSATPLSFTVTNTDDTGPGSLRQAILNANNSNGSSPIQIDFSIPGGSVIALQSALPSLDKTMIIDGSTAPGWDMDTDNMITIDGSATPSGFGIEVNVNNAEIYGLQIVNFKDHGINGFIQSGIIIGDAGKGNVISGNTGRGISYTSVSGTIRGNRIGTNAAGTTANPNTGNAIFSGTNGVLTIDQNLISGNGDKAFGTNATGGHTITSNLIGVDVTGTFAIPNNQAFSFNTAGGNTITDNLISGNTSYVLNSASGSGSNTWLRNKIGTDITGTLPIPNGNGIRIVGDNNTIGGTGGDGNIIAYNLGPAIEVPGSGSTGNRFTENEIFDNVGGIVLGEGANTGITPPTILSVNATEVSGNGAGDGDLIEVFLSDENGQGKTFIGTATGQADGTWLANSLSQAPVFGNKVVVTTTDASNNTSEFSDELLYYPAPTPPGTALAFDGNNDFVQISDDPSIDFENSDFTVEYWFRKNSPASNWSNIYGVSKWNSAGGNPGGNEWNLNIGSNQNDDIPAFTIESGTTTYQVVSGQSVIVGQWYHIAGVKEGPELRIYLDGVLQGTETGIPLTVNNVGRLLNIARNDLNTFFYSNADFDEIRIWRAAVSQQDLDEWKNLPIDESHPNYATLETYYKFDEGSGSSLIDLVGNNDGQLNNMDAADWIPSGATMEQRPEDPTGLVTTEITDTQIDLSWVDNSTNETGFTIQRFDSGNDFITPDATFGVGPGVTSYSDVSVTAENGYFYNIVANGTFANSFPSNIKYATTITSPGNAIQLDGVDDYIDINSINEVFVGAEGSFTVEMWAKIAPSGQQALFAINGDGATNDNQLVLLINSSNVLGVVDNVNSVSFEITGPSIADDNWQHIAYTRSGTVGTLYVNGVLIGTHTADYPILSGDVWSIGQDYDGINSPGDFLEGQVDEVRIWNIPLSQTDIQNELYNEIDPLSPGLVAYYKFDQDEGTDHLIPDRTATNYNGGWIGEVSGTTTPQWVPSGAFTQFDNALDFDGVDDVVTVSNSASLQIASTISITAWVKRNRLDAVDVILEKGGDWTQGSTNYGIGLNNNSSNNMFYMFWNGGGKGTNGVIDFEWHHYAVVAQEGNSEPLFYIDGVLQPIDITFGSDIIDLNELATQDLHIGSQLSPGLDYFGQNQIDEISVWNKLLTQQEINNIRFQGLIGNEPELRAYYRFNEGVPQGDNSLFGTLPDLTANTNDGSLLGFSLIGPTSNWVPSDALGQPEIEVYVGPDNQGTLLSNNQIKSVNYGNVAPSGVLPVTYTIENIGGGDLTIDGISLSQPEFSLSAATPTVIIPGGTFNFTVTLDASSSGISNDFVEITNDDPDEATYTFPVTGTRGSLDPKLWWTDDTFDLEDEIGRSSLDGSNTEVAYYKGFSVDIRGIAMDTINNMIFWTNTDAEVSCGRVTESGFVLWRVLLDESGGSAKEFLGIDVDGTGEEAYWADAENNQIRKVDFDGNGAEVLININAPVDVALDIAGGKMYYVANPSGTPELWRADLDGNNPELLYQSGSTLFNGVALDLVNDHVYWTESAGALSRGDINATAATFGSTILTVSSQLTNPESIEVDPIGEMMYVVDGANDAIVRITYLDDPLEVIQLANVVDPRFLALDTRLGFVDDTPPVVTIAALLTNDPSPSLTGTIDDLTALVDVEVNSASYPATNNGDGTWTLADNVISDLPDGIYDVIVTGTDSVLNAATDLTTNELTIDTTEPLIGIQLTSTPTQSPELTGSLDEPVTSIDVTVDGNTYPANSNATTWTLTAGTITPNLAVGTYDVQVVATDLAGNTEDTTFVGALNIEFAPSDVILTSQAITDTAALRGSTDNLIYQFSWEVSTVDLTNFGFYLTLGGSYSPDDFVDSSFHLYHNLNVDDFGTATLFDNGEFGDGSTVPTNGISWAYTDPITIGNTMYFYVTVDIESNATLDNTFFVQRPNGEQFGFGPANKDTTNLLEGTTFTILQSDTIAPVVTVDFLSTNDSTPPLSGTIDDITATISMRLDGVDYGVINNGDSTWSIPDDSVNALTDGFWDIIITSTDSIANQSIDTTFNALFIDTTLPVVSTDVLNTNDNTPPLTGTIDDNFASISINIDGSDYGATNNGDGTWTLADNTITTLADGIYDVTATATDTVGNVGVDNAIGAVTVDTTPPTITIDALTTADTTPELTGTVDDNGATITVDVDIYSETATNNGDGTWTLADNTLGALALGIYDVTVTATDGLGNAGTDATTDELEIIVDPGRALDSAALVQVYTATGGPNWTDNTNWLTGALETWTGVTVTADRVTAVDLSSNDLTGTFPFITTGLDAATDLNLSDNELTDVGDLSNLTGLTTVDVTDNRLQFNTVGALLGGSYTLTYQTQKEVLAPIQILEQVGDPYTLDRTVAGADGYSWFKDGTSTGQTTATINIASLQTTDDGVYTVEATSSTITDLTLTTTEIDLRVSSLERDEKSLRLVYEGFADNAGISDWSGTSVSEWSEVMITDNRVTGLDISGLGVEGPMADDLLDVEGLQTVDISDNEITLIPDVTSLEGLTSFDASENPLDFASIEPNTDNAVTFEPLKPFGEETSIEIPAGDDTTFEFTVGGTTNIYQWVFRNDSLPEANQDFADVTGATSPSYDITGIDYETMGQYKLEVSNTQSGIVLESKEQEVLATANISFTPVFTFSDGTEGTVKEGEAKLFRITESGPYEGVDTVNVVNENILFEGVKLGNYILNVRTEPEYEELKPGVDTVQFIPTYFESTIDWVEADVLQLRDFIDESLIMQRVPPQPADPGEGIVNLEVISDFPDDEGSGRIEARRRVQKAGCSLRRRTTGGGGRPAQDDDDFVLIAYKETDEEGRVNFGELPNGFYRINIQYPGIPMDPDSFVEFEIDAEGGVGGYELEALITEDGIVVENVLGIRSDYFKDLSVYPVPAHDELTISYKRLLKEDIQIRLTDLNGKTVIKRGLEVGVNKTLNLDVSSLQGGVYLLQVFNDREGTIARYKIIVNKQ